MADYSYGNGYYLESAGRGGYGYTDPAAASTPDPYFPAGARNPGAPMPKVAAPVVPPANPVIGVGGVAGGVPAGQLPWNRGGQQVWGAYTSGIEAQRKLAEILSRYGIQMEDYFKWLYAGQEEDILARGKAAEGEAFQRNVGYGTVGTTKLTGDQSLIRRDTEANLRRLTAEKAASGISLYGALANSPIPQAQAYLAADNATQPRQKKTQMTPHGLVTFGHSDRGKRDGWGRLIG